MSVKYLHLKAEEPPPQLALAPFCAVVVTEVETSEEWREHVTDWLVKSGCLYAVTWGTDCEEWHDSVDHANLREFDYGDIPEDRFVMTTWHSNQPLQEALWFAGQCAFHPTITLTDTLILNVGPEPREQAMLRAFSESQELPEDDG